MAKTKVVKGVGVDGKMNAFEFQIMKTGTALKILHEMSREFLFIAPAIVEKISESSGALAVEIQTDKLEKDTVSFIKMLPGLIEWDRVEYLSKEMLVNATANGSLLHDGKDFNESIGGDLIFVYVALFYAFCANYPKHIVPLLKALEGDDSSRGATEEISENSEK